MKRFNFSLLITSFLIVLLAGYFFVFQPIKKADFDTVENKYNQMQKQLNEWRSINDRFGDSLLDNEEARKLIPMNYEGPVTWKMYTEDLLTRSTMTFDPNAISVTNTQMHSNLITSAYEVRIKVTLTITDTDSISKLIEETYNNTPLMLIRDFQLVGNNITVEFIGFYY